MLNKLVRDKILDDMQALGQGVSWRKLPDDEFRQALAAKLVEEAGEFKTADSKVGLKELADILEVVEALAVELGADFNELRDLQAERRVKRGGFQKRIFVEKLELVDDDPWAQYYAKEPGRFKELP